MPLTSASSRSIRVQDQIAVDVCFQAQVPQRLRSRSTQDVPLPIITRAVTRANKAFGLLFHRTAQVCADEA